MAKRAAKRLKKQAILVLGMHRSGTSALAGSLTLMGAVAPRTEMAPTGSNPKGHFESVPIARFNDRLLQSLGSCWFDWRSLDLPAVDSNVFATWAAEAVGLIDEEFGAAEVIVVKDPRICRLAPLWLRFLTAAGYEAKIVLPVRAPLDVALSLNRRNGFSLDLGLLLWLGHVLDAERDTRTLTRLISPAEGYLADWRATRQALVTTLGVRLAAADADTDRAVDDFLEHELLSRSTDALPGSAPGRLCAAAFERLTAGGAVDLDDIRAGLDGLMRPFETVAGDLMAEIVRVEALRSQGRDAVIAAREATVAEREKVKALKLALADSRKMTTAVREKYKTAQEAYKTLKAATSLRALRGRS